MAHRLKNKFTVIGLLCLFIWNVALAGVPSLLVCLHEGSILHLESSEGQDHCESVHEHASNETETVCAVDDNCTDIEIIGAELIPARVNEAGALQLPVVDFEVVTSGTTERVTSSRPSYRLPMLRAPPSVHWLTDIYLSKTVIRV